MTLDLSNINGCVFDIDGLLISGSSEATREANKALLYPSTFWQQFKEIAAVEDTTSLNPHPGLDLIHKFQRWIPESVANEKDQEALLAELETFAQEWRSHIGEVFAGLKREIKPMPGAQEALNYFANRAALVTNNQRSVAIISMKDAGLDLRSAKLYTANNTPNKPDPGGHRLAREPLKIKAINMLSLGDNLNDIQAAVRACYGQAVLVNTDRNMLDNAPQLKNDPIVSQVDSLEDLGFSA